MNTLQALSILNPTEKTQDGLKKAWRAACIKHHPDKGGNIEIMKLVNAAYDVLKNSETWWTGEQERTAKKTAPLTETMTKIIDELAHIAGLKIEIIGAWLWISGITYPHKDILKKAGMKFSGNKKAWYYHEDTYKKNNSKMFSLDQLRNMHGTECIQNKAGYMIAAMA